jgi:hypothetical protein
MDIFLYPSFILLPLSWVMATMVGDWTVDPAEEDLRTQALLLGTFWGFLVVQPGASVALGVCVCVGYSF